MKPLVEAPVKLTFFGIMWSCSDVFLLMSFTFLQIFLLSWIFSIKNKKICTELGSCMRWIALVQSCTSGLVWFDLILWHINHCWLFKVKFYLYIYIRYIWFGLVWFYGISTITGYLMPNPLYTYKLNIYGLVWFCWVLWHVSYCGLFKAKFYLYEDH